MGQMTITPTETPLTATFNWKGKDYTFKLPKAQKQGVSLSYDAQKNSVALSAKGVTPAAYAVLCRGTLVAFQRITSGNIQLNKSELQTGVNELIIYDEAAQPLASRLFFINNGDYGKPMNVTLRTAGAEIGAKTTVDAYAPIDVKVEAGEQHPATISLAIRDAQTDERGYDNGNIMTDMLLSSELKGFIAYPAYYFENNDAQHLSDLDLLMKVQGWRRYKRAEQLRYEPEKGLTFEGTVYTVPAGAGILEYEDLSGVGRKASTIADKMRAEQGIEPVDKPIEIMAPNLDGSFTVIRDEGYDVDISDNYSDASALISGRVRPGILVEAEINKNGEMAGAIARTDRYGHFKINMPPYYGWAYLFAKAYNRSDSLTKNMQTGKHDKEFLNERAFPDFFVKQDVCFPRFCKPYSWYQTNSPQLQFVDEDDDENIPESSKLAGTHQLQTVVVKSRRRGRRGIDMKKPAIVMDAYDLYNELTDRGLMFGIVDFRSFPWAAATYLFGNMGRDNQINIRALVKGTSFYRNYTPSSTEFDKEMSQADVFKILRLERMQYVKAYTDYELRTDSGDVVAANVADVTFDFVPIENDGKRPTYRDRRYIMDGIAYPEEFYSPDYSNAKPSEPKDYRRTLYWNPNVKLNSDGTFSTTIYNNSRETRVTVSAAGVGADGQMYYK